MKFDLLSRIQNRWNKDIALRWAMLFNPTMFSSKQDSLDYQKELEFRANLSLNEIDALADEIPIKWMKTLSYDFCESLYYGALPTLLRYARLDNFHMTPPKFGVQHGYVFEICTWEKSKLELRNLVWSKKMVDMYHELTSNPYIYAIGAPFFYADSLLSKEQLIAEKKRLGKNLLAFPMHSQSNVDTNFDPNLFLNILAKEKEKFDSIRICMYWKDILRGGHKIFEDAGYEVVCNGHIYDMNFLRRQRSLFEISDATISNGVGSHIGYSIFLNKPHWLIDDSYQYINSKKGGDAKDLESVTKKDNFKRVKNAFLDNDDYYISEDQRNIVDEFWGISDILSPDELKRILLSIYE